MNKQEIENAIRLLQDQKYDMVDCVINKRTCDLSISALQHQLANEWTPVSKLLPDKGVNVIVTWITHDIFESTDELETEIGYISIDYPYKWKLTRNGGEINVIAWRPLPEPYTESI